GRRSVRAAAGEPRDGGPHGRHETAQTVAPHDPRGPRHFLQRRRSEVRGEFLAAPVRRRMRNRLLAGTGSDGQDGRHGGERAHGARPGNPCAPRLAAETRRPSAATCYATETAFVTRAVVAFRELR